MLRRPLTILSITPEDIADYEDRLAEKARFQARFIARRDREERRSLGAPISAPSHPSGLGGTARRRVIPSSSPSPPPLAQHPQQPEEESEEEEEEVSYYARAQHQARQVSLSFQGQQTPGQQFDGQEDEDVEMMSAPPLPPSTGVPPQTRLQARMGMGVGMGEQMETPSIVRAQPQRRSARERSREVESQQQVQQHAPPTTGGRLRATGRGRGTGTGVGQGGNGMEMVTPETRPSGRSREERIGIGAVPLPPQAPRRGRRGE